MLLIYNVVDFVRRAVPRAVALFRVGAFPLVWREIKPTAFVSFIPQIHDDFIQLSYFLVEFLVGICMFVIVNWLLILRMTELQACWRTHARIRYYSGLTIVGTAVNLGIGICGTINNQADEYM